MSSYHHMEKYRKLLVLELIGQMSQIDWFVLAYFRNTFIARSRHLSVLQLHLLTKEAKHFYTNGVF
jgi:hypothetical protein